MKLSRWRAWHERLCDPETGYVLNPFDREVVVLVNGREVARLHRNDELRLRTEPENHA